MTTSNVTCVTQIGKGIHPVIFVLRSKQVRQLATMVLQVVVRRGLQPQHASSSLTNSLPVSMLLSVSTKAL